MNDKGRAHCVSKLALAKNMQELKEVWMSFGRDYQADPQVQGFKDLRKQHIEKHEDE